MAKTYSLRTELHAYSEMYSYEKRLQTFADWPFREDCLCTPEQMAKAGFVHCPSENEPDVVSCFFCLKELEGWEPQDDPWSEHVRRAADCGFLGLNKDFGDLTVAEFFKLEQERLCILIRKTLQQKMASFRDEVELVRKNLETLFDPKDQTPYQTEFQASSGINPSIKTVRLELHGMGFHGRAAACKPDITKCSAKQRMM